MGNVLMLADLEMHDPRSPNGRQQRRFLCPFCGSRKPRDSAHRSLCSNTETGAWVCHRCGERGLLGEYWSHSPGILKMRPHWRGEGVFRPVASRNGSVMLGCEFDWRRVWRNSTRLRGTPGETFLERRSILSGFAELSGVRFSAAWYGRPAVLFEDSGRRKNEPGSLFNAERIGVRCRSDCRRAD
jgi:hypothetical protein